jgi:hypothetical protein
LTGAPFGATLTGMPDQAIEAICRDCGRPLSFHEGEPSKAVRCAECFDSFLAVRDIAFLESYAELGVTSRRIVAETCLRALVMESPPVRKVLAMQILEQYVQSAGDMIGLYYALKQRGKQPVMRAMLDFKLDRETAMAFFQEVAMTPPDELLRTLGLPMPSQLATKYPKLSRSDERDLRLQMQQMLGDVKRISDMGEGIMLALGQASGERRGGAAITKQSHWLDNIGLRADQVAAISLDENRRTVNIAAITVDEARLQNIISAIGAMTHISNTLIYATLTALQEEKKVEGRTK